MLNNLFSYYKFIINYSIIYNKILEEYNKYPSFYDNKNVNDTIKKMTKKVEIINYYDDIKYYGYYYNNTDKNNDKEWYYYLNIN